jgi:hypothetical protein
MMRSMDLFGALAFFLVAFVVLSRDPDERD